MPASASWSPFPFLALVTEGDRHIQPRRIARAIEPNGEVMLRTFRWRLVGASVLVIWVSVLSQHVRREYFKPLAARLEAGALLLDAGSHYYLAKMGGHTIGMATSRLDTIPEGFRFTDQLMLEIPAMDAFQRAVVETRVDLTPALALRDFDFRLDSEVGRFEVSGRAHGDSILELEVGAGGEIERSELRIDPEVVLPAALPLRLAAAGLLRVGTKQHIRIFDPSTLGERGIDLEVLAHDTLVVADSAEFDPASGEWTIGAYDTVPAWQVAERYGTVRTLTWLDEEGRLIRAESPLGFTLERTAYEVARAEWDRARRDQSLASGYGAIIEGTAIASNVELTRIDERDRLRFRLLGVELAGFDLAGGRQILRGDTLEVTRERLDGREAGYRLPYQGGGEPALELGATPLIQADDPRIVRVAREVAGGETDPVLVARKLSDWVYHALEKEVTLSVPSAVQVLEARRGDCNEHTALYIALARALGLPARTAVGVVYLDGRFFYHAWPEVWLDGWVAMDPTFGQAPADASHLRFLVGGLARQVELIRLIGHLRLEVI